MNSAVLDLVEKVAAKVKAGQVTSDGGQAFLRRIIHGPALAFVVKLTPTPLDDIALELFQTLIPQ